MIECIIFDLDDTLICRKKGELYEGVETTLKMLNARGYVVALASYNSKADLILKKHGMFEYFDHVLFENWYFQQCRGCYDYKETMLREILDKTMIPSENILFIDDQQLYLNTASRLGMSTCLVDKDRGVVSDIVKEYVETTVFREIDLNS